VASLLALLALVTLVAKTCRVAHGDETAARPTTEQKRWEPPGENIIMSIEIRRHQQALRQLRRARRHQPRHPDRRTGRAARPVRLRQDHAAAHHRRPGDGRQRARCCSDGEDATGLHVRERKVGFVFQHYALFRHMTCSRTSPSACA
jgi:hypothetical protein